MIIINIKKNWVIGPLTVAPIKIITVENVCCNTDDTDFPVHNFVKSPYDEYQLVLQEQLWINVSQQFIYDNGLSILK